MKIENERFIMKPELTKSLQILYFNSSTNNSALGFKYRFSKASIDVEIFMTTAVDGETTLCLQIFDAPSVSGGFTEHDIFSY